MFSVFRIEYFGIAKVLIVAYQRSKLAIEMAERDSQAFSHKFTDVCKSVHR